LFEIIESSKRKQMAEHDHREQSCSSDEDEYDYDYSDDPNLDKVQPAHFPEVEVHLMVLPKAHKTIWCIKGLLVDGEKQPRHQHIYLSLLAQVIVKRHASHQSDQEFADLCLQWCLAWANVLHEPAETTAPHPREGLGVRGLKDFHPPSTKFCDLRGRKLAQVRYWVAPSVGTQPVQHYIEKVVVFDRTGKEVTDEILELPEHDRPEFPAGKAFEYWFM